MLIYIFSITNREKGQLKLPKFNDSYVQDFSELCEMKENENENEIKMCIVKILSCG